MRCINAHLAHSVNLAEMYAKYYYKYTLILHRHYHLINIYTELAPKLSATASVAQLVEHWSSNPEDAGSIPSRKALELHFSQLVPVWVL